MRFPFFSTGLVGSEPELNGQQTHRTRINGVWFFSLSERFNGLQCQQYLFFICQYSLTPNVWNYTLVPQSKTWKEALQYCRDKFHSLATLEDQTKLDAAVVQRDFPVWIGLRRQGKAALQPSAGWTPAAITPLNRVRKRSKQNLSLGNRRLNGVFCRRSVELEQRVFQLQKLGVR